MNSVRDMNMTIRQTGKKIEMFCSQDSQLVGLSTHPDWKQTQGPCRRTHPLLTTQSPREHQKTKRRLSSQDTTF